MANSQGVIAKGYIMEGFACAECGKVLATADALNGHRGAHRRWGKQKNSGVQAPVAPSSPEVQMVEVHETRRGQPTAVQGPAIINTGDELIYAGQYDQPQGARLDRNVVRMQQGQNPAINQAAGAICAILPLVLGKLLEPKGQDPFADMGRRMFDRMMTNYGQSYGKAAGKKAGDKEAVTEGPDMGEDIVADVMSRHMKAEHKRQRESDAMARRMQENIGLGEEHGNYEQTTE